MDEVGRSGVKEVWGRGSKVQELLSIGPIPERDTGKKNSQLRGSGALCKPSD